MCVCVKSEVQHTEVLHGSSIQRDVRIDGMSPAFVLPAMPSMPPGCTWMPDVSSSTPAWYTRSGHMLVRPIIDGVEVGYMILDSGACVAVNNDNHAMLEQWTTGGVLVSVIL